LIHRDAQIGRGETRPGANDIPADTPFDGAPTTESAICRDDRDENARMIAAEPDA
jgi:hypothetical protein